MIGYRNIVRTVLTVALVAVILLAISGLWVRYQIEPLTRDGKVRADVVPVAADVAGLITEVRIRDNQFVHKGDVLLVLDRPRYKIALAQAEANVGNQRVALQEALREDRRNRSMPDIIPLESIEQGTARADQLRMALAQAVSARDLAQLNLDRTIVRAPVDGTVTNMTLQPGAFLPAGKPAVALVYLRSLRIEGYFEETKLPAVTVGDPATAHLMGVAGEIQGHVESLAPGIEDRERTGGDAQLANVNPSFTWVRLAQRIPVRIAIDRIPAGVRLIPGQTATVQIHPRQADPHEQRSFPW
jgi:multidrug resistance efflux pump